jgi:hypothetical protein
MNRNLLPPILFWLVTMSIILTSCIKDNPQILKGELHKKPENRNQQHDLFWWQS